MKEQIQARLVVQDIKGMSKKEFKSFIKWLKRLTNELEVSDINIYAKNPRWTLFK